MGGGEFRSVSKMYRPCPPRNIKIDLTTKKGTIIDGINDNHEERKEVLEIIQLSQVH